MARQNLSRFDLDLVGMHVSRVKVDGVTARFTRTSHELVVTPRSGLRRGSAFSVAVTYSGVPKPIVGSPIVFGSPYGWQYTTDGAFVGDEPNASSTWFPCNDHPRDKATFTFRITVPAGTQVAANGDLLGQYPSGTGTTFLWDETSPMATYLATINTGKWRFRSGHTPGGIRETVAYDPALGADVKAADTFGLTGRVTDYWSTKFGPYAFTSTGAIVDNVPGVGFSLETQTRPLYGFAPDPITLSHELSHQWFGDSVSVYSWQDIWLNEGFATFAQQLWDEHTGGDSTYAFFKGVYAEVPAAAGFWHLKVADPKRDTMFDQAVYYRGGMTLAALRHRIGDATFFRLLRTWTAQHRYGNATTAQFIHLAESVSGQDLTNFFRVWIYTASKPGSFVS